MREIKAIIRPERLNAVLHALHGMPDLPGVTVSSVRGYGRRHPAETGPTFDEVAMTKLEIVVPAAIASQVVHLIRQGARTGGAGDGKVFVLPVDSLVTIRSAEPTA